MEFFLRNFVRERSNDPRLYSIVLLANDVFLAHILTRKHACTFLRVSVYSEYKFDLQYSFLAIIREQTQLSTNG